MKKIIFVAGVAATVLAAIRLIGPSLSHRAMRKCQEMFDRMPEDFPPKRIMAGIDEIQRQNAEILRGRQEQSPGPALAAVD